jgi:hypothetical protein
MNRVAPSALLLLALGATALAQTAPGTAARTETGPALREELNEMLDAYLLMKVQERMGLTDEQLLKVMPLVRKYHCDRRDLEHRRFHLLMGMRQTLASGSARDEQFAKPLADLKAVEAELRNTTQRDLEAIDDALTPVQQVKYRLLEFEIDRHLRELRHRARERRGVGGAPAERGSSGDDSQPRGPHR